MGMGSADDKHHHLSNNSTDMPIFGVCCLKQHDNANTTNEKRLSVSPSSSIQGAWS